MALALGVLALASLALGQEEPLHDHLAPFDKEALERALVDADEFQSILKSFAKNKETRVRRHKDGTYSYNGPQNPAYEVW